MMLLVTLLESRRASHSNPKVHALSHYVKLPLGAWGEGQHGKGGGERKKTGLKIDRDRILGITIM